MKYVVCGLEHVGIRIVEALINLKEEVSLITLSKKESSIFFVLDGITNYTEGDARSLTTLKQAGIETAYYFLVFTSNELKNIEICCKAKEVNPGIKTAIIIQNQSYTRIAELGFNIDYVFHLPSIVSYPIASACVNRNIFHSVKINSKQYFLGHIHCNEFPSIVDKQVCEIEDNHKIKIIKHFKTDCKNVALVEMGDSIIYSTTKNFDFGKSEIFSGNDELFETSPEIGKKLSFLLNISVSRGIKKVVMWYTLLVLASVLIFKLSLGLSFTDAFYFVVTTTTTVGYGDFNFQNSPVWIKLYGCFIMIAGAALLATLFSELTDNIISKRLGRFMNMNNRKIKEHIIVAGIGNIGLGVLNNLIKFGIKTVVIEKNPENPNIPLFKNKVPVLIGDASDHKILLKAGIKKAKALAALIDDDLNNVNIVIKANNLNPNLHTVARIFNSELHKKAKSTFSIDNIVTASTIAIPFILSRLLQRNVIWSGYIQNDIYALFREKGSEILKNAITEHGLIPVFIERNGTVEAVSDYHTIDNNDHLYLFGNYGSLRKFYATAVDD